MGVPAEGPGLRQEQMFSRPAQSRSRAEVEAGHKPVASGWSRYTYLYANRARRSSASWAQPCCGLK
eukprot:1157512-Pelagomonas_calceolata.AAC.4